MASMTPDLLDGARDAFAQFGYERVTLEQIAQAAGVSRVTLHRRGIGKAELLGALTAQATAEYQAAMWPVLTSNASPGARLEHAVDVLLSQAERHLPVLIALGSRTDAVFHEPGEADTSATRDVFTEPLERILAEGIAAGAVQVTDAAEAATALFNIVGWSYIHLRSGHGWAPQRAAVAVRGTVLHGIIAAPP
jgi:AcrR family transcriptional regulator